MLELALKGNRYYWAWLTFLLCVIAAGSAAYLVQFNVGLAVTGMSRDVSWGFYIAQLTFLVGVAASTTRQTDRILIVACIALFTGTWIDKGLGLITGGFIPTPLHKAMDYTPTLIELTISLGIYSIGALVLTILFKIAVGVKREAF